MTALGAVRSGCWTGLRPMPCAAARWPVMGWRTKTIATPPSSATPTIMKKGACQPQRFARKRPMGSPMICAPANEACTRPATRPRIANGRRSAMIVKEMEPLSPPKMPVMMRAARDPDVHELLRMGSVLGSARQQLRAGAIEHTTAGCPTSGWRRDRALRTARRRAPHRTRRRPAEHPGVEGRRPAPARCAGARCQCARRLPSDIIEPAKLHAVRRTPLTELDRASALVAALVAEVRSAGLDPGQKRRSVRGKANGRGR